MQILSLNIYYLGEKLIEHAKSNNDLFKLFFIAVKYNLED